VLFSDHLLKKELSGIIALIEEIKVSALIVDFGGYLLVRGHHDDCLVYDRS
jgi:hypothetical protein